MVMNKNVNTEYKYNYSPLAASFLMSATYRVLLVLSSEPTLNCGLVRLMVGKKRKCSLSASLLREVSRECPYSLYVLSRVRYSCIPFVTVPCK